MTLPKHKKTPGCTTDTIPVYAKDGWTFIGWYARCRRHRNWHTGTYRFRGFADVLARRHISDHGE